MVKNIHMTMICTTHACQEIGHRSSSKTIVSNSQLNVDSILTVKVESWLKTKVWSLI